MEKQDIIDRIEAFKFANMLSYGIIEGTTDTMNSRPIHSAIYNGQAVSRWYELGAFGDNSTIKSSGSVRPTREDFNSLAALGYNNLMRLACGMQDSYTPTLVNLGMQYPAGAELIEEGTGRTYIASSNMSSFTKDTIATSSEKVWFPRPSADETSGIKYTMVTNDIATVKYVHIPSSDSPSYTIPFVKFDQVSIDADTDLDDLKERSLIHTGTYWISDFTMQRDFYGWILPALTDFSFSPQTYDIEYIDKEPRNYRRNFISGASWRMTSDSGLNLLVTSSSRSLYYSSRIAPFDATWMTYCTKSPPMMPFYYHKGETYHFYVDLHNACILYPPGSNNVRGGNKTKFKSNSAWNCVFYNAMFQTTDINGYKVPSMNTLLCSELLSRIPEIGLITT